MGADAQKNHMCTTCTDGEGANGVELLTLEEELLLTKFYSTRLQHACLELRVPRKVQGTAIAFLRRLYVHHSMIEHDPQHIMLACLYLACKAEESYISAAELERLSATPAAFILRHELTLLTALQYDLVVYHPYRALEAFWEGLCTWLASLAAQGRAEASAQPLSEEARKRARDAAVAAADALQLTDAPLLYSPGQLALAALRSGFLKQGVKLRGYLDRLCMNVGNEACDSAGAVSTPALPPPDALAKLTAVLSEIDRLGADGAKAVDQEAASAADKKLKACRAALLARRGGKADVPDKAKARSVKAGAKVSGER